jgi:hypothetical protein
VHKQRTKSNLGTSDNLNERGSHCFVLDLRSDRTSRRDKLRLKFVKGYDITDLPDLALRELVLAGHVYVQGMVVPDERRNESGIISVLIETRFGFQQNRAAGRRMQV